MKEIEGMDKRYTTEQSKPEKTDKVTGHVFSENDQKAWDQYLQLIHNQIFKCEGLGH